MMMSRLIRTRIPIKNAPNTTKDDGLDLNRNNNLMKKHKLLRNCFLIQRIKILFGNWEYIYFM